jgi:hypothetical protein
MKSKVIILFLFFIWKNSYSQNVLPLSHKVIEQAYVILPTAPNLSKMLFASMSDFKATMNKYNYGMLTDRSGFAASTPPGGSLFTITKESDAVNMVFIPDNNNFATTFKNGLRKALPNAKVTYEKGAEVYSLKFTYQGLQYRMKIMVKEDIDSTLIAFVLQ